jgi:hypothetical protein
MRRQKRFETVFRLSQLPSDFMGRKDIPCWRITGSGVHGRPEDATWTHAITARLESYGIAIERYCEGTPVNVDAHYIEAPFLDGGLFAVTGNYWCSERGAWVYGPHSALFVGLALGLRMPKQFAQDYHISASQSELEEEVGVTALLESVNQSDNPTKKPYFRFPDYAQLIDKLGGPGIIRKNVQDT